MKLYLILTIVACSLFQICYAGFRFGMVDAVKDKVKKLDEKVAEEKKTVIIKGKKTISGEDFVLEPGMTVKFESKTYWQFTDSITDIGEIILNNGSRLIAQGTSDNPIVFQGEGKITFEEDSDGLNSIIEYCRFENIRISMKNSVGIRYSKFDRAWIQLYKNSQSLIEYNDFNAPSPFGLVTKAIDSYSDHDPSPTIQFNNIKNYRNSINLYANTNSPIIKNNNITNSEQYAISAGPAVIIDNNYIADCNGKSGPDTTGEQVDISGSYTNPRTTPVPDAGSGW